MLVLTRQLGEAVVIDNVEVTVVKIATLYVDVSIAKSGGARMGVVTLYRHEPVEICYNAQVMLVDIQGPKVRLGFNVPYEVNVIRKEFLQSE